MDPTSKPAAGSRPQKQTMDQAPAVREQFGTKSDIFGAQSTPVQPSYSRSSARPKSDIFSVQNDTAQRQTDVRQNNTYKSSVFTMDAGTNNTHSRVSQNTQQSKVEVKQYQSKNNENKQQDHGKDFLFGKSDFDEYKTLRRTHTQSEFKPKQEYDPIRMKHQQLYGTEISRDHLPSSSAASKPKNGVQAEKKQQQEQDPGTRKQMENTSSIFGDSPAQATPVKKVDKLTPTTSKWSNVGGNANNEQKDFDPDQYAKDRKEAELQSSIFGGDAKPKQQKPKQDPKDGKKVEQPKQKPKDRLIPNNQNWTQTDSIKNKKDFQPGESGADQEQSAQQKKFDTLKSTLDTHEFQGTDIPQADKISTKNLKYKGDIMTRESKLNGTKQTTTTKPVQQKQPQQKPQKQQQAPQESDII